MRFLRRKGAIGVVDTRGARIQGWACDPRTRNPVNVEFYADGIRIGAALADRPRRDLTAMAPDGRCGFDFTLPAQLQDGIQRTIEVRVEGARKPLTQGRFTAQLLSNQYEAGIVRWLLRAGLWTLQVNPGDGVVDIEGWYIPAPGSPDGGITVNGRPVALTTAQGASRWKSAVPPQMTLRNFTGTVMLDRGWQDLHFSFGLERAFRPLHDFHFPLLDIGTPALEHRRRVDDQETEAAFNLGGYSTAMKLDTLARHFTGRPLAALGPVLDWGCGCGRVARFVARSGADLSGADIDAGNVGWCSEHIRGRFIAISPDPPTPFENDCFAAIYGISVFTHLDRQYEKRWLAELHRIARPGALLLVSVLGATAAAHAGVLEHVMSPEFADGFADIGRNPDIDLVTRGSAYYRNVFHQPHHIAQVWGEYFDILSIEEGIVGNNQDLVVMRKRTGPAETA